ncbi:uncharacterized protein LOC18422119 [Amborella trichopoda]|nr:uncharacterized protein LOC18422119 [Amborella trichopoda]|eukprot:XP_006826996.2 uncharacterized protein LOC18422119 [Amborella trichopoda]
MEKDLEVEAQLKLLNKPAIKTFQAKNGDVIDCVDIYKQPAFDHPLLKNHTTQMRPSFSPAAFMKEGKDNGSLSQMWKENEVCPQGSVPILRVGKDDILRANPITSFVKKSPNHNFSPDADQRNQNAIERRVAYVSDQDMEYGRLFGGKVKLTLWRPGVENSNEFSEAKLWAINDNGPQIHAIQAEWSVNPGLFGNYDTRFFAYWTDSFMRNRKMDINQQGVTTFFVQVSSTQATSIGSEPHLMVATKIQFGGEVVNLREGGRHTATKMGSGHFGYEGYAKGAAFEYIQVANERGGFKDVRRVTYDYADLTCYAGHFDNKHNFYFGGPGRSDTCP